MKTPAEILNIPKFDQWFPGQQDLYSQMKEWTESDGRFLGCALPTGYGKSLLGMLTAVSGSPGDGKVVFLTSTKGLQSQLMSDFGSLGMVDIRGQNDYTCIEFPRTQVDKAPCHTGYACPVKAQCHYYSQLDKARRSHMVVTNYHYWMYQTNHTPDGLDLVQRDERGQVISRNNTTRLLICDEAHQVNSALESFLSLRFTKRDHEWFPWQVDWDYDRWVHEARLAKTDMEEELVQLVGRISRTEPGSDLNAKLVTKHQQMQALDRRLNELRKGSCVGWVPQSTEEEATWTPVKPGVYNHLLFQSVPKVLLMSAMFTKPMMQKLNIQGEWIDAPSPFPVRNTPIMHINTVRVDYRATDEQMLAWVKRIDEIIGARQFKKGIIFTVSYARARFLAHNSIYSGQMYQHTSRNIAQVVEQFKKAKPPAVLVSPSVTTGYDFPEKECEYIVVGKIPYPDSRGALIKARQKEDSNHTAQLAMEVLVQEAGRGTRSATDRCQVFVVDDTWKWWWPKHSELAPSWFRDRILKSSLSHIPIQI